MTLKVSWKFIIDFAQSHLAKQHQAISLVLRSAIICRFACYICKINSFSKHIASCRGLIGRNFKPFWKYSDIIGESGSMPKKHFVTKIISIIFLLLTSWKTKNFLELNLEFIMSLSMSILKIFYDRNSHRWFFIKRQNLAVKFTVFVINIWYLMIVWLFLFHQICVNPYLIKRSKHL